MSKLTKQVEGSLNSLPKRLRDDAIPAAFRRALERVRA